MEDYHYKLCHKKIEIQSKRKHFQSLAHNKIDKCIHIDYTIRSPDFSDVYEIINDSITNH